MRSFSALRLVARARCAGPARRDVRSSARPPERWYAFLREVWPDDPASIGTLQELFGYLLTSGTRLQKIFLMVGPRRSGKGTIFRVLRELLGADNVAAPTLSNLATEFGLAPLLGKSVALVPDARLSNRADAAYIVERLLSISGEDPQTVNRKHLSQVTTVLRTRFVIASNELPRLGDASGALAGRLILLRMTETFYGREIPDLADQILAELPGILLWAIAGWIRLLERGRFVQPQSGAELVREMDDAASPVGAFVREHCVIGAEERVEVGTLFDAWVTFCSTLGVPGPGIVQEFSRVLRAVVPGLKVHRPRHGGERRREYGGVRLRGQDECIGDIRRPPRSAWSADLSTARAAREETELETEDKNEIESTIGGTADHADQPHPKQRRRFKSDPLRGTPLASGGGST